MRPLLKKTLIVVYSLMLIPVWGLAFLSIGTSNRYMTTLGLLLTYFGTYFITRKIQVNGLRDKLLISIGPIFYLVATLLLRNYEDILTFPIVWAFVIFILALLLPINHKLHFRFVICSIIGIYSFVIYPMAGFDKKFTPIIESNKPKNVNLKAFRFIHHSLDTIPISLDNRPILIETWNETCAPCIASIKDLQDTLAARRDINHFYLYQSRGGRRLTNEQIFSFKHIKSKNKILIDLNNNLFDSLNLNSYPYFLIFANNGNFANHRIGYMSDSRNEILSELLDFTTETKTKEQK